MFDNKVGVPTNGFTDATPCVAVSGPAGGDCDFSTVMNAQVPAFHREGQAAGLELQGFQVFDLGADGNPGGPACPPVCGTGDEKTFVEEGVFAP